MARIIGTLTVCPACGIRLPVAPAATSDANEPATLSNIGIDTADVELHMLTECSGQDGGDR